MLEGTLRMMDEMLIHTHDFYTNQHIICHQTNQGVEFWL